MITQTRIEIHINWQAVIEWCRQNPYSEIYYLKVQDGIPMKFSIPSGLGLKEIPIKRILDGKIIK